MTSVGPHWPRFHVPNSISIGSDIFAELMIMSNRHTDRPVKITVAIGRDAA